MTRQRGTARGERWIVIHDGMPDHPKVFDLSDKAFRTLITLWCWCGRHLTDGQVPEGLWRKVATSQTRKELQKNGLVDSLPDGGVMMHDYLEWQRSAREVTDLVDTKRRAGRLGNHQRWHVEAGKSDPRCEFCTDAEPTPEPSQNGSHMRSQVGSHTGSQNDRRDRDRDRDRDKRSTYVANELSPTAAAHKNVRHTGTRIPDDSPTPSDLAWAQEHTPLVNLVLERDQYRDYWTAKGGRDATKKDWPATWRRWCRTAQEQTGRATAPGRRVSSTERAVLEAQALKARYQPGLTAIEGGATA